MRFTLIILLLLLTKGLQAQPPNNLCSGATPTIADGTCYTGTTTGAADNITGEAGCATQGGPNNHRDIWYSFTATTTTVEFNITSAATQTIELLLLSGTCGSITLENSTCQTSPLNTTFAGLNVGQTYYYLISFPGGTQADITTCVNSITAPPSSGQNCATAEPICSNSSFDGNSDGFGVQELNSTNQGCLLSNERQSSWYYFQIQTSGTLDMTIDPFNNVDYDFALWGPMATYACPVSGSPIRCSYASSVSTFINTGSYNTGFGPAGTEASDGTGGTLNGWASSLNVNAGEFYILVIDNFQIDNTPFTLSWGGSSILSCAILLPVELSKLEVAENAGLNLMKWATLSEIDNHYFAIERSADATNFREIGRVSGQGNSNTEVHYEYKDLLFERDVTNCYRLRQVDYSGSVSYSPVVAALNQEENKVLYETIHDLTGREFDRHALQSGLYVITTYFSDESVVVKKIWIQ
jgi:hypothetical protein